MSQITITQAETDDQVAAVRSLMREYIEWSATLGEDNLKAPTFSDVDRELAALPDVYVPPMGRLLLALVDSQPAGCVALKPHDPQICELKRLYVQPIYRGMGVGHQLVQQVMQQARQIGYTRMALDSHITMTKAHAIYEAIGFQRVGAPPDFPEWLRPMVVFMECDCDHHKWRRN